MTWQRHLISLALVAITWIVFCQVLNFDFVDLDDGSYVFDNPHVLSGFSRENLHWVMIRDGSQGTGSWHPLTWLSLMLDSQLFGNDASVYHRTNLLIHTVNVLLLFTVLRQITGGEVWKSGFVAALFAIHPLHVESVAWISERKDVLSTFFGLISLWAYARYARRPAAAWYWYGIALAAFALSLLSKQMLVTLPFVFLILDYWPLARIGQVHHELLPSQPASFCPPASWRRLIGEKTPFLVLTAASCVVALWSQHRGDALVALDEFPLGLRLSNALVVWVLYIVKTIWPTRLACYYPFPETISLLHSMAALAFLATVSWIAICQRRVRPYLLVGWLWYLGILVPVIGLVQIGGQRMADRYTYFPLIGLFIAIAWFVPVVVPAGIFRSRIIPAIGSVILVTLAVVARQQTSYWRDTHALYLRAAQVTDRNHVAHFMLAAICYGDGHIDESIRHFRKGLLYSPDDAAAYNDFGLILKYADRPEEAAKQFERAIQLDSRFIDPHVNLGNLLWEQGRYNAARRSFQEAIKIEPAFAMAHRNLAFALLGLERYDEAQQHLQYAARLDPQNVVTERELAARHMQVGKTLASLGKHAEAIPQFQQALRWMRDERLEKDAMAVANHELGKALLLQNDPKQAEPYFREALRLKPDFHEAQSNLERALIE